jgi:transcription elongation GreA/GreB family factor
MNDKVNTLLKEKIIEACFIQLNLKIKNIQLLIKEIAEDAADQSKSSAGDKHETARALAQTEQENLSRQLDELYAQKNRLKKINPTVNTTCIGNGSLVKTNRGWFFIGEAMGRISVEAFEIFTISSASPLALAILGLKEQQFTVLNGNQWFIEAVQ